MQKMAVLLLLLSIFSVSASEKWYVPSEKDALVTISEQGKAQIEKKSVKMLIWNAHKEGFDYPWQQEFTSLSEGMDFILLQESITKLNFWLTKYIFPDVYNGYAGVVGFSFYYLGKFNGNVNLSTYNSIESKVLHTPDREPVVDTVKPVLITRYQIANGKILTLANIHSINFVGLFQFQRQMDKAIEYLSQFDGPVVFGGDFNTWNQAKTDYMNSSLRKAGFEKVALRHPERVKKVFDFPIDHIFVRDATVLDADFLENRTSDHTPMMLELAL